MPEANGNRAFIPSKYHDDPEASRGMRLLLNPTFEVACMNHGTPITADQHAELRKLLVSPSLSHNLRSHSGRLQRTCCWLLLLAQRY